MPVPRASGQGAPCPPKREVHAFRARAAPMTSCSAPTDLRSELPRAASPSTNASASERGRATYEQALNPGGPSLVPTPKVPGPLGPPRKNGPIRPSPTPKVTLPCRHRDLPPTGYGVRGIPSPRARCRPVPHRAPQNEPKVETGLTTVRTARRCLLGGRYLSEGPHRKVRSISLAPGPSAQQSHTNTHPRPTRRCHRSFAAAGLPSPNDPPCPARLRSVPIHATQGPPLPVLPGEAGHDSVEGSPIYEFIVEPVRCCFEAGSRVRSAPLGVGLGGLGRERVSGALGAGSGEV